MRKIASKKILDDEEEAARIIEKNLVKDVYDHIADDFSASRYKMWPLVEDFVDKVSNDHFVVGKYLFFHSQGNLSTKKQADEQVFFYS